MYEKENYCDYDCGNPSRVMLASSPPLCADCGRPFERWDRERDQPFVWTRQDRTLVARMAVEILKEIDGR